VNANVIVFALLFLWTGSGLGRELLKLNRLKKRRQCAALNQWPRAVAASDEAIERTHREIRTSGFVIIWLGFLAALSLLE